MAGKRARRLRSHRNDNDDVDVHQYVPSAWQNTVSSRGVFIATDGLSKRQQVTQIPVKKRHLNPTDLEDAFASWNPMPDENTESDDLPGPSTGEKRNRDNNSTNPNMSWRPLFGEFLDEVLHHEGLADAHDAPHCSECSSQLIPGNPSSTRLFRCSQCGEYLQCMNCCLKNHQRAPLHSIQEWNGAFWLPQTLTNLGLTYQLGHGGFPCPFPEPTKHAITIIDAPAIFTVRIRYCGCPRCDDLEHRQQLLRNAWYPATVIAPATCATFRCLRIFRLYNVVGNLTVSDFITALQRYTNALSFSGLSPIPGPTRQFQRMSRQWSCLSRAKRTARGHDPLGVAATLLGACAVLCWACPHDGKNLPTNWRDIEPKFRVILAIDANFRLKNRLRANEINDPPLGPGWAYWVDPKGYSEHVKNHVSETDLSTCIAFAALLQKNTRMTTGLRVSGVGGCVCARHECMRPNGLGDLQKGERYCNMDWIFFSAIMTLIFLWLTVSYDIACQWKVHLLERMKTLPSHLQRDFEEAKLQFGIPVWHADSHEDDCRDANALGLKSGVGKTDGEAIERVWSKTNAASFSTKEMGLGHRADVLDDVIDNHNFLKNLGLGNALQRKLVISRAERQRQIDAFVAVSDGVEPTLIRQWKKLVREWQGDSSKPNPYQHASKDCPTEAEIRLRVQREERASNPNSRAFAAGSSGTSFIAAGIQIEDAQARIAYLKHVSGTLSATQETEVEELRLSLLRKITRFRELQLIYMPGAAAALTALESTRDNDTAPPDPESIELLMLSEMERHDGHGGAIGCLPGTEAIEENLRVSQCENSLRSLRSTLNAQRWLIAYRNAHLVGQNQTTKAAKMIASLTEKSRRTSGRYRRGFTALCRLGVLQKYPHLQELKDADVALAGERDASDVDARERLAAVGSSRRPRIAPHAGNSRHVMSWIWTAPGAFDDSSDTHLHESIRVEWTRALARKTRWIEEVYLLEEEMR
ncbi:hypothetical protein C8F01DRAFT_1268135 [Mycena amicta]|nr:hypothetical protein C8F01DRAFT_1268135 [Mycena amicta]